MKLLFHVSVIPRRRLTLILLGIFLNAVVFSTAFTFLDSFQSFSYGFLGEEDDLAVIWNPEANTIFSGSVPLYLSYSLKNVAGVVETSPEVLTQAITNRGAVVSLRGVSETFFTIQDYSSDETIDDLGYSECLLGTEASKRLELDTGDTLTLHSSMRNVVLDLKVKGIIEISGSLEDEVFVHVDVAKLFSGTSEDLVTLIRVKLDPAIINQDTLNSIITSNNKLTIHLTTSEEHFQTELSILQFGTGQVIQKSTVAVPGIQSFDLPYGKYLVKVKSRTEEVNLDKDQTITFVIDPELIALKVNVMDASTGQFIENASIRLTHQGQTVAVDSSKKGGNDFLLLSAPYNLTVSQHQIKNVKQIYLTEDTTINVLMGKFSLIVKVLDSQSLEPLTNATVIVTGENLRQVGYTDNNGLYETKIEPGTYLVNVKTEQYSAQKVIIIETDPTILFLLGEEIPTHRITVTTHWSNGTIARFSDVELLGNGYMIKGTTNNIGQMVFFDIPAGHYRVTCDKGGHTKAQEIELTYDQVLNLIIPSPLRIDYNKVPSRFIRYLPQNIAVSLSSRVFNESMKVLTSLIRSVIIILSALLLTATITGNYDIINNAVKESEKSIGILRSIGATKPETIFAVGVKLVLYSGFTGISGYVLGYTINQTLSYLRLMTIAGYVIKPSLNPWILVATVGLSSSLTALALITSLSGTLSPPIMNLLKGLKKSDVLLFPKVNQLFLLLTFTVPFIVRAIPELKIWPLPIGWDTVTSYIPGLVALRSGLETQLYDIIYQRPFFWAIISLPYPLDYVNPFKVMPLILHGLLGASIYLFARTVTKDEKKSAAISLLSTLYFVSLRLSWDLHANEMGLILVFICLAVLRDENLSWTKTTINLVLVLALTLTHEAASIMFFVTAIPEAIYLIRRSKSKFLVKYLLIIALPLTVFAYRLVTLGFPLIMNAMNNPRYPSGTYQDLVVSVLTFYVFTVLSLSGLFLFGLKTRFDTSVIKSWILGASIAALSPIFSPTAAFSFWTRWCYLLGYPLSFYAVEGLSRLLKMKLTYTPRKAEARKLTLPIGLILGLVFSSQLAFISYQFVYPAPENYLPYQTIFGRESSWVRWHFPSSMQLSTVYPDEAAQAVESVKWLNEHAEGKVILLVDEEFRGYASLYHDQNKILLYDLGSPWYINTDWKADAEARAELLSQHGLKIYLLARDMGFERFTRVKFNGKISIYQFAP